MSSPDRGPAVFVVSCVMAVLATTFTILRLISKLGIRRKANSDDWLSVLACLFIIGMAGAVMSATRVGLGKPDAEILSEWENALKKAVYVFTVFYNPSLVATKMAILLLYMRMATAHPFFRYASMGTLGVVVTAGVVLTFLNIFQCRPIVAAFSDVDGTCIDLVTLYLSSAPINILTDLAILCLPLPVLTSLRMERRQKLALVLTFVIGGFAAVVDIVRIYYLQSALREEIAAAATNDSAQANFFYEASFSLMWSIVEVSVGLMCCCALVLKPLVMRVLPAMLHEASGETEMTPDSIHMSEPTHRGSVQPRQNRSPEMPIHEMLRSSEDDGDNMDIFAMFASGPAPEVVNPSQSVNLVPIENAAVARKGSVMSRHMSRLSIGRSTRGMIEANQQPTQTFFDFVNMGGNKPLTQLGAREAWWPVLFVSILFFLWGFAYGLLGTLNGQIQAVLDYTPSQTIALHNAYWLAYFVGPATFGYQVLSRWGFKATFITGLSIYAVGAMAFWPSSVLASFPGFFISNFIIALGLSTLETAANPFIALAGPGEYSEARLNFAQGIQGIGSVLSPILAQKALFKSIDGRVGLFDVQWCYLAVALFVAFLAVVFFYVPLSEASDDELEAMALQRLLNADLETKDRSFGIPARQFILWTAVFVMVSYVGAQEAVSYYWGPLVAQITPQQDPFWNQAISHAVFAFGRFFASGIAYLGVPPRYILTFYLAGAFLTSLLTMVLPLGTGALTTLILLTFFESAIFPTLFAMALRGQGKHTKFASAALAIAISGGALWPSVAYAVDVNHPSDPRQALVVTVVLFAVSTIYPILLSSNKTLRKWVDPKWSKQRVVDEHLTNPVANGSPSGSSLSTNSPRFVMDKAFTSHLERISETS